MKNFKWTFLFLLILNMILYSCNNSNAGIKQADVSKKAQSKTVITVQHKQYSFASDIKAELDKAKNAGKVVFLVVSDAGTTDTYKATNIADTAKTMYKNSVVVLMNRDNSDADLVAKWRLAGAPLPLILVISPKGFPTGGYLLNNATAEKLVAQVPTPKLDDIYESLNNGKPVFLVISKKSYTDRAKIIENCKSAASQLQNKASIVEVDLDDTKEAGFIKQMNLKNTLNKSTVLVLNTSGQTTDMFEGSAEPIQLALAANKVISGGCGSSCKPGSCGPKK